MPNVNQVQVNPEDKALIEKLREFLQIKEAKEPKPAENVQGYLDYLWTREHSAPVTEASETSDITEASETSDASETPDETSGPDADV